MFKKSLSKQKKISVLGKEYEIDISRHVEERHKVFVEGGRLIIFESIAKNAEEVLETWLREIAKKYANRKSEEYAKAHDFEYNRISIKDTRSRWGSCSSKKNLNFSWRLVMSPVEVFDYVIVHELCHLKEMNHSIRFWSLVASIMPDYKSKRDWLRKQGRGLF